MVLIFGTKKLRNIGADLGGAVKGFKDGIKDGEQGSAEASAPAAKVTQDTGRASKDTIDVEAKNKG